MKNLKRFTCSYVLLAVSDLVAFIAVFSLSFVVSHWISESVIGREFMVYSSRETYFWMWLYIAEALSSMMLFAGRGHYAQRVPFWEQLRHLVLNAVTMMLLAGFILYVFKLPFSRLWVVTCWAMTVPFLVLMRFGARNLSLALGGWGTPVVLIGDRESLPEVMYALAADHYNVYWINDVYIVGSREPLGTDSMPAAAHGCRQHFVTSRDIYGVLDKYTDCMVILMQDDHHISLKKFMLEASKRRIEVAFAPPLKGLSLYGMRVQNFFGSHTVLLRPRRPVDKPLNRIMKRAMDVIGALAGLVLLGIPMLAVALMIKRDGGPAFYAQERVGYRGRPFRCWKFRSMVANADEVLHKLLASDAKAKAEWEKDFKLKNDPRVTRLGQFIRKTSIDELPQLWNVLRGDMSLVGPRPIVAKELTDFYGDSAGDYMAVKPGVTGLWQVSGRNDVSYDYRVYLDTWYVSHWSVWTDIVIIIETLGILISRDGAY